MSTPRPLGFTGVDWHARTTERLAGDLLGGAGAQPITTAAQETARLAAAYGEAAVALDRLIGRLDGAIDMGRDSATEHRTGPLPEYARWLARHAADLAEYAAKLAGHAAAHETAARAMPPVAEAVRLRTEREDAHTAAVAGGHEPAAAALVGATAARERAEQQGHTQASAVMVGFERAAHPLRAPWEFAPPPGHPANPRQRAGKPVKAASTAVSGSASVGSGGAVAAPLGVMTATALARDAAATARSGAPTAPSGSGPRGMPMMPAGMLGAGATGTRNTAHTPGASASDPADDLPDAFVVHAAPAVLGAGVEQSMEEL